jgi:hypothetical protein
MTRSCFVLASIALVIACEVPMSENDEIASGGGDGDAGQGDACLNDAYEPNGVPEQATLITWEEVSPADQMLASATVVLDGFLCPGEHDWYRLPIEALPFEEQLLLIDGLVMGTSWCGQVAGCEGATLPDAAANTLGVEIYDAGSMVLLGADIATNGRADVDGWGPNYSKDLLIHVYAPSAVATYAYELHVDVRNHAGEDECEC